MNKSNKQNALDFIPQKKCNIIWHITETGSVLLIKQQQGLFHPRVCSVELEPFGSFIWGLIDGQKTIYEIALLLKKEFGESTEPLFPRITIYFRSLSAHGFIFFRNQRS